VLPIEIDHRNQIRQRHLTLNGDLFQPIPKRDLKADARHVTSKSNRALPPTCAVAAACKLGKLRGDSRRILRDDREVAPAISPWSTSTRRHDWRKCVIEAHPGHRAEQRLYRPAAVPTDHRRRNPMTPPAARPSKQPTRAGTPVSETLKFSKKRLALAFAIAGISDAIGAFATPLPPIVWVVDLATVLLLFIVLGRQWLLLPGLALEAIPGLGVLPFWLLVVGAIAVLGTPRPVL
jgi:hypothetical protein